MAYILVVASPSVHSFAEHYVTQVVSEICCLLLWDGKNRTHDSTWAGRMTAPRTLLMFIVQDFANAAVYYVMLNAVLLGRGHVS